MTIRVDIRMTRVPHLAATPSTGAGPSHVCVTDPDQCCGTVSPVGALALKVHYGQRRLARGGAVGPAFCETDPLDCSGSPAGTGLKVQRQAVRLGRNETAHASLGSTDPSGCSTPCDGSGGGGTGECPPESECRACETVRGWTFELPELGVSDCGDCATATTWELCQRLTYSVDGLDNDLCEWVGDVAPDLCGLDATLQKTAAGTVYQLNFGGASWTEATYELSCSLWDPVGCNEMVLVHYDSTSAACGDYPSTVTVCANDCAPCEGNSPIEYEVDTSGITDGDCDCCDENLAGVSPVVVQYVGSTVGSSCCSWIAELENLTTCSCTIFGFVPAVVNLEIVAGVYVLTFPRAGGTVMAQYELAAASWDCAGANVMSLVGTPNVGCTYPATITVTARPCEAAAFMAAGKSAGAKTTTARRGRVVLPQCPELGRPLRDDELIARGFNPAKCGCSRKIRVCGLHDLCTTGTPRDGMACCATCLDHPSRATPPVDQV